MTTDTAPPGALTDPATPGVYTDSGTEGVYTAIDSPASPVRSARTGTTARLAGVRSTTYRQSSQRGR